MNHLLPAQAAAQLFSLFVYATLARWYVTPRLATLSRADALAPLVWIHVFRYVALQAFSAQRDGFPISDHGLMDIVVGDVAGSVIALATLFALRYRSRLAVPLAWLLVVETAYDTLGNVHGGMQEHLLGAAGGVTWLILGFFVPLVVVSLALITWQLVARRNEPLAGESRAVPRDAARQTA
jgi:hypothetical protein